MRRCQRYLAVGSAVLLSGSVPAALQQQRLDVSSLRAITQEDREVATDFSGTWIPMAASARPLRQPDELRVSDPWGSETTIAQTADTLTVRYMSRGRSHASVSLTYRLDGAPTANIDAASVRPQERHSTAEWQGDTLVITMSVDWPDPNSAPSPRVTRQVLSLETPVILRVDTMLSYRGQRDTSTFRYRRR
jgi:hypothetical protein